MTILLVTHALTTVADEATQVLLIHGGRHREGAVGEILRPEVLEPLYGMPVRVDEVAGRRVVTGLPGRTA